MGKVQIVIEIDDKLHGRIFHSDTIYDDDKADVVKAIVNGTPLPKNHGRLIDADELKTSFPTCDNSVEIKIASVRATINYTPTIIEGSDSE